MSGFFFADWMTLADVSDATANDDNRH